MILVFINIFLNKYLFVHSKIPKCCKICRSLKPRIDYPESKAIFIKNLEYSYNKNKKILNDINLTVDKNERIALLGVNGAGKSTLLSLISLEK